MAGGWQASWWEHPGKTAGSPVVRHAPDDDQYHTPDDGLLAKIRGGNVGHFAVIPAANDDGTSKGFDAGRPGLVHVDPEAPDGGVIFDPNAVTQGDLQAAADSSFYPHEAFYKLGTSASLLGYGRSFGAAQVSSQRVHPISPGDYVVPRAMEDGRQAPAAVCVGEGPRQIDPAYQAHQEQAVHPVPPTVPQPRMQAGVPPVVVANQVPQPQALPQALLPAQPMAYQQPFMPVYSMPPAYPPQPAGYLAPAVDPTMTAVLGQIAQGLTAVSQRLTALEQRNVSLPGITTGMSPVPMPMGPPPGLATLPAEARGRHAVEDEKNRARPIRQRRLRGDGEAVEEDLRESPPRQNGLVSRQTLSQYERDASDDSQEGVIVGFETLGLPWLSGPVAHRPGRQVVFELPDFGKHTARYHDVIESDYCVALVYDTRYEEGQQYLPDDRGETEILLHVPSLKKTFSVSSMGFSFAVGALDVVVMVKHNAETLTPPDEAAEHRSGRAARRRSAD